ncbi:hypothetical protein BJX61DRAFT_547242 [Aspergillus egyptiacus]|nr:hypothetical protein BJX61DRAFT_547242 [Aspergillus egyptiacus]
MASPRKIMSLHRTLLYILSLSQVSFALDQDVLGAEAVSVVNTRELSSYTVISPATATDTASPADHTTNPSHSTPPSYNQNPIPSSPSPCSAPLHCYPGDYCFHHFGAIRCCPEGLACVQITGDVNIEQAVVWYEEVYTVEKGSDYDDDDDDDDVLTSWDIVESTLHTTTRVTATASFPEDARVAYASLTERVRVQAVETPLVLIIGGGGGGAMPTRTRMRTAVTSASTAEDMVLDGGDGDGQVVLA